MSKVLGISFAFLTHCVRMHGNYLKITELTWYLIRRKNFRLIQQKKSRIIRTEKT